MRELESRHLTGPPLNRIRTNSNPLFLYISRQENARLKSPKVLVLLLLVLLLIGGLYIGLELVVYGSFGLIGIAVLGAITIILIDRDISKNPHINNGTNDNRGSKTEGVGIPCPKEVII